MGKLVVIVILAACCTVGLCLSTNESSKVEKKNASSLMDMISPPRRNANKQCYDCQWCCDYCYSDPTTYYPTESTTGWDYTDGTTGTYTPPESTTGWDYTEGTTGTYRPPETTTDYWTTDWWTTQTASTTPRPTCPPAALSNPQFTKSIYQSSLPSWPVAGTTIRLGIQANTTDGAPLRYQLVTTFEFLTLSASQDIIFTSTVSDRAFVGPNNVMIIEVTALVIGDEERASNSAIALVFPRSTKEVEIGAIEEVQ